MIIGNCNQIMKQFFSRVNQTYNSPQPNGTALGGQIHWRLSLRGGAKILMAWRGWMLRAGLCRTVSDAVKARVPGWSVGKPIPEGVLDEIFADEKIASMVSGDFGTAEGLDVKV